MAAARKGAALIIAGGLGTRLWPEGRRHRPKPLFALDGKTSLLAATIRRLQPLFPAERIFVLVVAAHAREFRQGLGGLIPLRNLIIEPIARGTAVAIAYGSAIIRKRLGDDVIVAVAPADHHIPEAAKFRATLGEAIAIAAREPAVVVIGITPTRPETGYGYQEIGARRGRGYRVARFVEKPDLARARRMVRSGKFLWNGGYFVMALTTLTAELRQHAPGLADAAARFGAANQASLRAVYARQAWGAFDRVIAEKSSHLIGVQGRFRWDDVGSWDGLFESQRGASANLGFGDAVMLDSRGVLARGGKRLMVLVGVDDLIAVDTDDALLIMRRSRSQELGRALEELRRRGFEKYL